MDDEQEQQYCDHCGAALKKYRVGLTKSIAQILIKLRRLEVALDKKEIWLNHDDKGTEYELTKDQRSNMSRLRVLGLARYTEAHSGTWFITRRGYAFLRGESVPKEVWMFRNKIVEDMRTEETVDLATVFRKADVPYFEPIIDQQIADPADLANAVQQRLV